MTRAVNRGETRKVTGKVTGCLARLVNRGEPARSMNAPAQALRAFVAPFRRLATTLPHLSPFRLLAPILLAPMLQAAVLLAPALPVAFLMATALPALAETTPRPGPEDNRVRIATWTEGQVYRVVTNLTRVTSIEFGEGETIRAIIAGDTAGFQFDGVPGGRAFAIKPVAADVATNITVYTNLRSYYFHVVEAPETPHYVVQFRYPEAASAPLAVAAGAPNANYAASGQGEFAPAAVWDDGTFTWFRFPRNAPIPAIFRWSDGAERVVNAVATEDGVIRVSGVHRQWVLRLGEEVICIQDMSDAMGAGS